MTLEQTALILAALLLLFFLKKQFYSLFFVVLLTTEFYYIRIGGGIARPYHFLAVLVVLMLARYIPLIFRSKLFIALLVFVGVNICAIILSDSPDLAGASFFSFCANVAVAMATTLILLAGKISLDSFKKLILTVTVVSVIWGIVQILIYSLLSVNLALSPEQVPQIQAGLAPAFRTEANSFGKFMVFPFLFFLPDYLQYRTVRNITLIYLLMAIGIIMNFTRTSIYGMGIALIFILFWYIRHSKFILILRKWPVMIATLLFGFVLILSGAINVSEYNVYKLNRLFNQEEILEGGSSAFRIEMMKLVVSSTVSDAKRMIIGNGWGQTHVYYNDAKVQAGGGDLVNIFGYAGFLGVFSYLAYSLWAFFSGLHITKSSNNATISLFAEGSKFALLGIFFTGQMAGYLIAPEYWMLIGICIYLSLYKPEIACEAA